MSKTLSAKYYQETFLKKKKKKKKKKQYGCERYKNLPEKEKQSLLSIEKNIIE